MKSLLFLTIFIINLIIMSINCHDNLNELEMAIKMIPIDKMPLEFINRQDKSAE
jgi:hypothetical protein